MSELSKRQRRRRWLQPVIGVAAVILVYYAWPVRQEGGDLVLGVLLTLVGVGLVGWAIAVQIRRHVVLGEPVGLPALVTLLGTVLLFRPFLALSASALNAAASPAEQDMRAQLLYEQRGASPWPALINSTVASVTSTLLVLVLALAVLVPALAPAEAEAHGAGHSVPARLEEGDRRRARRQVHGHGWTSA